MFLGCKVVLDWNLDMLVTPQFTKLFYCERVYIAHISPFKACTKPAQHFITPLSFTLDWTSAVNSAQTQGGK